MFMLQSRQNKVVDWILHPFFVLYGGHWWTDRRFESPVISFVVDFDGSAFGPFRALINPGAQQSDLFGCQPVAFLRHQQIGLRASDCEDEQALCALAGNNGGA